MKIAIIGINGKMGREVANILKENNYDFFGISKEDDFSTYKNADILIEFTNSQANFEHIKIVLNEPRKYIIGTTGFSQEQLELIKELSKKTAVFLSYNFSYGLNVLLKIIPELYKRLLDYDIALYEIHHKQKKDKPSGTAKMILEKLKEVNNNLNVEIGSFRIGGVFGEHYLLFSNEGEVIEIKHKALSRKVFAIGVLKAIEFIKDKEIGFFTMSDLI
ncbi:MAG: 4-hydroxy-tetrahydrodipicolinate reductase [candidate division WOR-3 bacterium]|jgi:4-hydroxy-tetrahydrodipicolinate reductase